MTSDTLELFRMMIICRILRQSKYISFTCADQCTHTHIQNTHTTAEYSNKNQTQTVDTASQTVAGSSELGE